MDARPEMVRTLFIHTPVDSPLGADVAVHVDIMRALDRQTHEIHLALAEGPTAQPTPLEARVADLPDVARVVVQPGPHRPQKRSIRSLTEEAVSTAKWIASLVRLGRYIRRHSIDVLHTCDRPRDAVAAVVLGRLCRVPSIVHVHVGHADWMSRQRRWGIAAANDRFAVSDFVRETLLEAGVPPDRTHTVLNSVDARLWEPDPRAAAVRQELGIAADAPMVLFAGRLFEAKGELELVEAFGAANVPDARLVIAGRDPTGSQQFLHNLEARIAQLGIADRVLLVGWRDDLPALMTAADVFAMPSTGEPCALVYLEAMAAGLPIIALDDGGTPELVLHERQGLLSAHGDVEALASNLRRLLSDESLRQAMGESGRRRVAASFTPERQATDVANLYRSIILGATSGTGTEDGHHDHVDA